MILLMYSLLGRVFLEMSQNEDISRYYLGLGRAEVFKTAAFADSTDIHKYFTSEKKSYEYVGKYEALNSIIDCFADLRGLAEHDERKKDFESVVNPKKEIPIELSVIDRYFRNKNKDTEPPLRIISKIAEEHFNIIDKLAGNLNRVLRRDRSMVPVSQAQQIDVQCIRWLSRQPGRTTYERAGNRQKILSIIRYESVDTLENRVFKQFLKYCIINCDSYLHEYAERYAHSSRIKSVRRLRNLVAYVLNQPEFDSISMLNHLPRPNYVLQNNAYYRVIWNLYLDLLNRTRLIESLWSNRDVVMYEFIRMIYLARCHSLSRNSDSPIKHVLWIKQFSDSEGSFLNGSCWNYLDFDPVRNNSYIMLAEEACLNFKIIPIGSEMVREQRIGVAYIPDICIVDEQFKHNACSCIAIVEKRIRSTSGPIKQLCMTSHIVDDAYHLLGHMLEERF